MSFSTLALVFVPGFDFQNNMPISIGIMILVFRNLIDNLPENLKTFYACHLLTPSGYRKRKIVIPKCASINPNFI